MGQSMTILTGNITSDPEHACPWLRLTSSSLLCVEMCSCMSRIFCVPGGRCVSLHVCFIIDLGICVNPTMGVQGVSGCGWYASGGREKMCVSVFVGILLYMKHLWARQVLTPTLSRNGDRKAEKGKWGKRKSGEKGRGEERAREKE